MEMIPPHEYSAYVASNQNQQGVTDSLLSTSSPHVKLHRFVKDYAVTTTAVAVLPVSEGTNVAPAEHSQALGLLKVPCKSYVAPTAGLTLPRLAAASDPHAYPQPQASVLVVKEFLVHDAPTDEDIEQWQALHTQCDSLAADLIEAPAPTRDVEVAVLARSNHAYAGSWLLVNTLFRGQTCCTTVRLTRCQVDCWKSASYMKAKASVAVFCAEKLQGGL